MVVAGDVRTRPDVLFPRHRVAIYVDGCFWHRCPLHATDPKANSAYWGPKLNANVARDRRADAALRNHGWTVLRFWEHENPAAVAEFVEGMLRSQMADGTCD
jgi:DNA mismatch endonuclease (patch repair protein)